MAAPPPATAELHVHLEGAIPDACLAALVRRHGGDPAACPRVRDFPSFLAAWAWRMRWLRSADDLAEAAEATAAAWAGQGLVYVEAHCSPIDLAPRGLAAAQVVEALRRGLDRVAGVRVALIVDLVRDHGPDHALAAAGEAAGLRHLGVVAVGLGGREASWPAAAFAPAFALARAHGLGVTVHAGETSGPAAVEEALAAGAQRIGHGIRAAEDPWLLQRLARDGVHLEVCPTSNLRTGAVRRIADHPLPRLIAAGVTLSLNSDDPALFATSLAQELHLARFEFGLDRARLAACQLAAADAAFLPPAERAALRARLASAWLPA